MQYIEGYYDYPLVIISLLVAILASYEALELNAFARQFKQHRDTSKWLIASAFALGIGIWSMHFIGMYAFQLPIPIHYDFLPTLISLAFAIGTCYLSFLIVNFRHSNAYLFIGSLIMGGGITSMHYIGMMGMHLAADMQYDPVLVITSILIAIVASYAALYITTRMQDRNIIGTFPKKMMIACLMGFAISGMHYTGMAATRFIPNDSVIVESDGLIFHGGLMVNGLAAAAIVLLLLPMLTANMQRRWTRQLNAEAESLRISENSLRASEERQQLIFENIAEAIIVLNVNGLISSFNNSAERLFGYKRDEVINKNISILMPEPYSSKHDDYIDRYIQTGVPRLIGKGSREVVAMHKQGQLLPVELLLAETGSDDNREFIGVVRDLAERKRVEGELIGQRDFTDAILEIAGNVIVVLDQDGRFVRFNRAAETLTGFSREEILGQHIWDWLIPEDQLAEVKNVFESLKQGNVKISARYENDWLTRDGKRVTLDWHNTIMRMEQGNVTHIVALGYDLTERKLAEQQLSQLNESLEARVETRTKELNHAKVHAEAASQAKSRFLTSMSHELRTPLNAILGFSELLTMKPDLDIDIKSSAEKINQAGKHLLELINQVLDLTQIESGKMELDIKPSGLYDILKECHLLVAPLAKQRNIKLKLHQCCCNSNASVDRTRLKQIILNLLSNAVKYNREGGEIHMNCDKANDHRLRISVRDTGHGIEQSRINELFEPFNRLGKEAGEIEGSGIGLVITQELVEKMGGTLGIKSVINEGSTFWIDIPMSSDEQTDICTQN